ncbi:MAG: flagellar hook-basal body complex protein [Arcobacteraceae bacterium]|nr:flagellar hook-basal body complex protein [Arcobacteraceae bacterium]
MIGALWTGISGLSSHQKALDNEAHNIANVNTVGYKASRIAFADQMYQDRIGKGSKVLDAEKIYEQGTLKPTGVAYDVALSGDGFLTVANKDNGGGTAETYYTRAGNLRMGDNGTLQDAAGNEVQGWIMTQLDTDADVISTNPNITRFTNDYTKLVSTEIVSHANYVETITAKTTDYNTTSKSDSSTVFSGAGYKTESGKIADIEELSTAYAAALQKYKENPDGLSASAVSQISFIDFEDQGGIVNGDSDIISVYVNGVHKTQEWDTDYATTMKKLADQISSIPGLKAYMVDAALNESTLTADVNLGIMKIESLIPGEPFLVSGVLSQSGTTEVNGAVRTTDGRDAVEGSGLAALESVRNKLSEAVTGKQRDVFLPTDLFDVAPAGTITAGYDFDFRLTIWDKDAKANVSVPAGGPISIPAANTVSTDPATAAQEIATEINANIELNQYIVAKVVNGALVLETKDSNFDVEFSTILDRTTNPDVGANIGVIEKNATHSGREGAGAEFIELRNKIDQTASRDSLQLRLDTLGISDTALGEFSVDKTGLITIKQDGVSFAIGQLAIALFNNNRGLEPVGDNLLAKTNESGSPMYNINNAKAAEVQGRTLELSEADLSESLVNLMVFQRAFEANAKSITTSDELLNTLINLKR